MSSEDAHKRAIEDYSQHSQNVRASAQFLFAANGGAALAMLSFLTAITTTNNLNGVVSIPTVIHSFAYAAGFYLAGVFLTISSTYIMALAKQQWGDFWEHVALTDEINFAHRSARLGTRLEKTGFVLLSLAGLMFLPGCAFAVSGFIR